MAAITTDDGVRLNYVVDDYREPWRGGPPETVFLAHGYMKSLEHWRPFAAPVAREYRVVRLDTRGAGKSSAPGKGSVWSIDRLLADVTCLLDALGVEKVHWAGFESGGLLGILFAAKHPGRIRSVACFNTPYRNATSESTAGNHWRCGHASVDEAIDKLGVEEWARRLCEQGVLIDPVDADVVRWVATEAAAVTAPVAKAWYKVFARTSALFADAPEKVRAPVLLVAGAKHVHGCQPPLLDQLRLRLPAARDVVYVPGVAIGVQLLAADACASAYLDFLSTLPA